jgi:hypothetical protein
MSWYTILPQQGALPCDIDEIIQRGRPRLSLAETFKITPPVPDVLNPESQDPPAPPVNLAALAVDSCGGPEHGSHALDIADKLNLEQRVAYIATIITIFTQQGKTFFIDGPGGTGKSFLYRCITTRLHSMGRTDCSCASTGLIDGCTVHKLYGVPMLFDFGSISIFKSNCKSANIYTEQTSVNLEQSLHRFAPQWSVSGAVAVSASANRMNSQPVSPASQQRRQIQEKRNSHKL